MSGETPDGKAGKVNRYEFLPTALKVYYNVLTVIGIAVVVYYMFGFTIKGFVFVNVEYYYLLFGLFGSTVFLILPEGSKTRWYDYLLSAVHLGLSLWFAFHGNEIATKDIISTLAIPVARPVIVDFVLVVLDLSYVLHAVYLIKIL
jgi:hypothetical protein